MAQRKQVKLTQQQLMQTFVGENNRLEEINRRIMELSAVLNELTMAIDALKAMKQDKEKIMVPLGAGVFLEATAEKPREVVFSMTGGVLKTKKAEEVKKELETRKEALQKVFEANQAQRQRTATNVNTLSDVLREGQRIARQNRKTK